MTSLSFTPPKRCAIRTYVRLGAALAIPVVLGVVARGAGLHHRLTLDTIRAAAASAGPSGAAVFVLSFCLGELAHVPGLVFVAAGVLAYGPEAGGLLAFAGAIVSVSLSFWVVRTIGGRPLGELRTRWFQRALGHLDARPIRTIAMLRVVFILSPPLNYALALSNVRFRDYLAGSTLGLAIPIAIAIGLSHRLVEVFQ